MIKILLGGSPCMFWSIARAGGRETTASGTGWELFRNYLIAKERFKPDYFLYENNSSASKEIQEKISSELNISLMHIDSGLLSAQNRKRFYAFNWNAIVPDDKGLRIKDIILDAEKVPEKYWYKDKELIKQGDDKSVYALMDIKAMDIIKRVYNQNSKSPTLTRDGGGGHRVKKVFQNGFARKLTPIEYERLQTLPDDYTKSVSDSQRYNCIGNGWTAEVIIHLLKEGLKNIPRDEKLIVLSMYDGIGTGRYCLERLGFSNITYYAYEIDKHAVKVALDNYPDIIEKGDAFQLRSENWNLWS